MARGGGHKWRTIKSAPLYAVSDDGRVRRTAPSRGSSCKELKLNHDRLGYARCGLYDGSGACRTHLVHRLVCEAFNGPPPTDKHQVAHGDGNPGNNRVDNLRWATRVENEADKLAHGSRPIGEDAAGAVLTWALVREMRGAYGGKRGEATRIAEKHGLRISHVYPILRGERWADPDYAPPIDADRRRGRA